MPVRLARFEMPKRLQKEDATATATYAKFSAEPFETGYGHTIGNSLRRVLLSSLEGAAITSVKIEGAQHEFAIVDGVVGMEGNGPLQGEAKNAGVLIFGEDFVSVDASAARLMTIISSRMRLG